MATINSNLPDWIKDHLRRYIETDGADDDNCVLVASKGGHPQHLAWYLNVMAEPEVRVQVGADKFTARTRTAEGGERAKLWAGMRKIWPQYDDYQKATAREIPVVVLERA